MRERFQDETTAHNMAEAAAYRLVQRQAQVFGNQIQNERTRIQLGQLERKLAKRQTRLFSERCKPVTASEREREVAAEFQ